jgi:rare lipoprotein A
MRRVIVACTLVQGCYRKQIRYVVYALALSIPVALAEPLAKQEGDASYYAGRKTADGNKNTAASPNLPQGTHATVTNKKNGKSVDVEINDRGPSRDGRIIDLSKPAAKQLDMTRDGIAPVVVEPKR